MIERFDPNPNMHKAVAYNGLLFLSGIVPADLTLGMEGQTASSLEQIGALLEAHGSSRKKVLQGTVYVTDLGRKEEMNRAWQAFFGPDVPTRATIGIADLGPGVLIEIVVTAVLE